MLAVICTLCQQRPACVHVIERQPDEAGVIQQTTCDICHHCLSERGIDPDDDLPPLLTILDHPGEIDDPAPDKDPSCPHCGLQRSQFISSKRCGCAHDYDCFADVLLPLLEDFHGGSHHCGRTPCTDSQGRGNDDFQRRLLYERQLQAAIANEDYERAAQLRDQLRDLGQ